MAHSQRQQTQSHHFWLHPAHCRHDHTQAEEARDDHLEPLLSHNEAPLRNSPRTRSLIPWSPGQTIDPEPDLFRPSLDPYERTESYSLEEEDDDARNSSCCSCRSLLCCCCCKCCQSVDQQETTTSRTQQEDRNDPQTERRRKSGGSCCLKFLHLLISVVTLAGLCYYSSKFNNQHWTMNPGESRQVQTAGILTDSVQILSMTLPYKDISQHNSNQTIVRGMAVYTTGPDMDCPLLTGDPVTVNSPPQEILLLHNAFQYQYYYLNKGSTMQVTVYQSKGACNILVLKGSKVLARMQNRKKSFQEEGHDVISDLELFFSTTEVVVERVSWTEQGAPIQFSFTSPENDVYVLLFDNSATNNPAAFNVSYHMVLTTYNLEGLVPWCSHSAPVDPSLPSSDEETFFTCPPLPVASAGCIIVEATEENGQAPNTATQLSIFGDDNVEITLYATRRWLYIGILSLIPSVILAIARWFRQRRNRPTRRRERRRQQRNAPRSPHRRHDLDQRPSFHFLSPHGDHEVTEIGGERNMEGSRRYDNRQHSSASDFVSMDQQNINARPRPESNHQGDGTESTTVIPAENVTVVKSQDSGFGL